MECPRHTSGPDGWDEEGKAREAGKGGRRLRRLARREWRFGYLLAESRSLGFLLTSDVKNDSTRRTQPVALSPCAATKPKETRPIPSHTPLVCLEGIRTFSLDRPWAYLLPIHTHPTCVRISEQKQRPGRRSSPSPPHFSSSTLCTPLFPLLPYSRVAYIGRLAGGRLVATQARPGPPSRRSSSTPGRPDQPAPEQARGFFSAAACCCCCRRPFVSVPCVRGGRLGPRARLMVVVVLFLVSFFLSSTEGRGGGWGESRQHEGDLWG